MLALAVTPAEFPGLAFAAAHEAGFCAAQAIAVLPGLLSRLTFTSAHGLGFCAFYALPLHEIHILHRPRTPTMKRRLPTPPAIPTPPRHLIGRALTPTHKA